MVRNQVKRPRYKNVLILHNSLDDCILCAFHCTNIIIKLWKPENDKELNVT